MPPLSVDVLAESEELEGCTSITFGDGLVFVTANRDVTDEDVVPQVVVFDPGGSALTELSRITLPREHGLSADAIVDGTVLYVSQAGAVAAYDLTE